MAAQREYGEAELALCMADVLPSVGLVLVILTRVHPLWRLCYECMHDIADWATRASRKVPAMSYLYWKILPLRPEGSMCVGGVACSRRKAWNNSPQQYKPRLLCRSAAQLDSSQMKSAVCMARVWTGLGLPLAAQCDCVRAEKAPLHLRTF